MVAFPRGFSLQKPCKRSFLPFPRVKFRGRRFAIFAAAAGFTFASAGGACSKRLEQPRTCRRHVSMQEALDAMQDRAKILFGKLDTDGSGYLDVLELQSGKGTSGMKLLAVARTAGIPVEFLATVLERGDSDGDGFISQDEFVTWMLESERRLKEAFDRMDLDQSGLLSKDEVNAAMHNLELPCGGGVVKRVIPQSISKLVDEMGVSDTHEVDYEEFRYSVITLARKDLATVNSYWSRCYVAGPYGDGTCDYGAVRSENALGHILAGCLAGLTAKTFTAPLEVVLRLIITGRAPPGSTMPRVFSLLIRDEGIVGLFKGSFADMLRTPPTRFLELSFLQVFRDVFSPLDDVVGGATLKSPMAGAFAGACAMALVYPLDTLSARLSVTKRVYTDLADAMRRTVVLETPNALYYGILPTLIWAFPYVGIQFAIVNHLERRHRDAEREALRRNRRPPAVNERLRLCLYGVFASTVSAVACMPLETIRRRMQVQSIGGRQQAFSTFLGAFARLVSKNGFSSLYIGFEVLALKTAIYSALSYATYESARAALQPVMDRSSTACVAGMATCDCEA